MYLEWRRLGRFYVACLLVGPMTACNGSGPTAPSSTVSDAPLLSPNQALQIACTYLDTVNTVFGVVSEQTPEGFRPVGDATVELFRVVEQGSDNILEPLKAILTAADGSYSMCVPPPLEGSGATGSDGQAFEVHVRKSGYRTVSHSFRYVYNVWGYDGVKINLDLERD